jgi:hypothetical protein
MEIPLLSRSDLKKLVDRFVIRFDRQQVVVTNEFQDELKQNMAAVSHLSTDCGILNKLAMLYCLIRVFEPIREEQLLRYLHFLLSLG